MVTRSDAGKLLHDRTRLRREMRVMLKNIKRGYMEDGQQHLSMGKIRTRNYRYKLQLLRFCLNIRGEKHLPDSKSFSTMEQSTYGRYGFSISGGFEEDDGHSFLVDGLA